MSKKLLAILIGILAVGLISGTAFAGREGLPDLSASSVKIRVYK